MLIGWMLLTAGAKIDSAEAQGGTTTEATLARTGATEYPDGPQNVGRARGLSMTGSPSIGGARGVVC